eukprot:Amastigsp_a678067_66.p3 type:complete len:194 gc:universal Amastigsp_a678067_66:721-1302(+)
MRTGSRSDARWSFATLDVIVAENRYVLRSDGTAARIVRSSSSKSMLRMRSASSSTRNLSVRSENPFVFSRWSTMRPGVPTMMCGFFARFTACVTMSTPPTTVTVRAPIAEPMSVNCCAIWIASSRVGVMQSANTGDGAARSALSTGRAKLAVLPEPVSASPMMSRPWSAHGMASAWIPVGPAQPISRQMSQSC